MKIPSPRPGITLPIPPSPPPIPPSLSKAKQSSLQVVVQALALQLPAPLLQLVRPRLPFLVERKQHSFPQTTVSSPRIKGSQSFPSLLMLLIRKLWTLPSLMVEKSISWSTTHDTYLAWYLSANPGFDIDGRALIPMSKVPSL